MQGLGDPAPWVPVLVTYLAGGPDSGLDEAFDALGGPGTQAVIGAVLGLTVTDRLGTRRDVNAIAGLVRELRAADPDPDFKPMIAEAVIRIVLGETEVRRWISDEDFVFAGLDVGRGLLRRQHLNGEQLTEFIARVEDALRQAEAYQAGSDS